MEVGLSAKEKNTFRELIIVGVNQYRFDLHAFMRGKPSEYDRVKHDFDNEKDAVVAYVDTTEQAVKEILEMKDRLFGRGKPIAEESVSTVDHFEGMWRSFPELIADVRGSERFYELTGQVDNG